MFVSLMDVTFKKLLLSISLITNLVEGVLCIYVPFFIHLWPIQIFLFVKYLITQNDFLICLLGFLNHINFTNAIQVPILCHLFVLQIISFNLDFVSVFHSYAISKCKFLFLTYHYLLTYYLSMLMLSFLRRYYPILYC